MATFVKLPSGSIRAQVQLQGVRKSVTRESITAARKWATKPKPRS